MNTGAIIKRWQCILILLLMIGIAPSNIYATEPAPHSLPPELMELQSQGKLTVRALWAWKLVPESTAGMALEFRSLGYDLLGANNEQLTTWLQQAEYGQLQLNAEQKAILTALVERMNSVTGVVPPETAQVKSAEKTSAETRVAVHDSDSSSIVGQIVEVDNSSPRTSVDTTDITQMVADLGVQADAGNTKAMLTLALLTKTGATGPPDPYRAIKLLEDAASAGEADAMAALADEYASGLWIKQDEEKARQLRQQAAEAGSQLAMWEVE
ncbi:tetratricopeptide repeat protein [Desulfopila aestuarii]|nr:SEL1-like repeat protein [Desulfopila aestuarii]